MCSAVSYSVGAYSNARRELQIETNQVEADLGVEHKDRSERQQQTVAKPD